MADSCLECARLANMIQIRKAQLVAARQLLDEHLDGRNSNSDTGLILITPGNEED